MSVRISEYDIKAVKPANKRQSVIDKCMDLIDFCYLKESTVIQELDEFAKENDVEFVIALVNDFGRYVSDFPIQD